MNTTAEDSGVDLDVLIGELELDFASTDFPDPITCVNVYCAPDAPL